MTTPDRFPVPVRSAVKSNLTVYRFFLAHTHGRPCAYVLVAIQTADNTPALTRRHHKLEKSTKFSFK